MSKDKREQAGALLSAEEIARNQEERNSGNPPEPPPNPDAQNQGSDEKPAPVNPSKLTADQYLKRAPQGAGISELARSLYKTKIMSFEEWENTVKALLKKQVG